MLFRSATVSDTDRVAAVVVDEPVGWIPAERYLDELGQRMYRPEWTWLAEDEGRLMGRALWWGQSTAEHPVDLDCLYVDASVSDRAKVAAGLLSAGLEDFAARGASRLPIFTLRLTGGWRDDPAVVAAYEWRHAAAQAAGLSHVVERLQLEWTADAGLPAAGDRLTYARASDEEFLEMFRRIAVGTLDDGTRKDIAEMGAEAAARHNMDFYLDCLGERDWWRLAYDATGEVVGLAIPSATPYARNIGYIGVVPEFRGRGYVDEVLAEMTRMQAEAGAERITATTDMGNAPMAAAFARAGYKVTEIRMVYSVPAAS
ncbi:GNAT family N-acetyltransferase [Streptomyces sp. TRM66268-LWL]|uniref:GNAT family N-acetyltransferase n=1 Tax=Streptomyces polyasparticus TaxID=2767826 RepID=A0ABR7SHY2_9ACTN|nr:GNAT family N-acetyltransferase [Streptomyces polyasparticus]MBC9714859.1 GNAT family N-acetyltransferase [Streptomyces polyasparticus]